VQIRESNNAQRVLNMNTFQDDKNLLVDVELLRSKFFTSKVVQRMPLEVSYFNRGQILTEEFYLRSPFKVSGVLLNDSTVWDQPISLLHRGPGRYMISYSIGSRLFEQEFLNGERVRTPHFSAVIEVRRADLNNNDEQDLSMYFKINDPRTLVNKYVGQISVRIVDHNAKTIEISCIDQNNMLARDLVRTMAQTFIDYDLERQGESAENVLRFIKTQKDTVFEELRESEYRLQQFKIDNRVADLAQLTPIYLERSKEYENEIVRLNIEERLLQAMRESTDKSNTDINVYDLLPLLAGTDYGTALRDQIIQLQEALEEREKLFFFATPANDEIRALDLRINIHKNLLLETIRHLDERSKQKRQELEWMVQELDSRLFLMPEKELQFARLERLFSINEKYYTQLLAKDIEYRISRAGVVPENRILEEASLPTSPLAPNRNMVLFSYLMAGIIAGFIIVVVRYILHDNITSLHDIAKLSNAEIGILGMIPKYKKDIPISQLLIDKNPKSLIAESFRTIRTNLQFVDNRPGAKVIAITSTISGEGKTFVAINLAGIISYSGKRVIILDLDMRKPKIHLGFGVENISGMSTLLIDKDTLENCVRHSSLEGLDFITAGPIPPNPSELIISPRMLELVEELKQ
jgi:hypothetical protein